MYQSWITAFSRRFSPVGVISSEGLPCKQNEHLFGQYSNKVVATESSTSNQEDPCKEVNRENQG